jgi:hypothetical protein
MMVTKTDENAEIITHGQAKQIIVDYKGSQFFTVTFVKRTDGAVRVMNCRKGVHKGTRGGALRFDPVAKGLVSVFDIPKGQHRFISLDQIIRVAMPKKVYLIK